MNKINLYVFIQIIKSCTLIFFIFVSIAWLTQISRLFAIMNNLNIEVTKILHLSTFLIPNLAYVILPFIVMFGLVLTFIKFDKDKELIAFFSLGLSINEIKKPLQIVSILILIMYIFLNFFLSPYIYEKYKKKEFEIRNYIDFNNINISNFIEIDRNTILDFKKNNNQFEDIFKNYNLNNESLIYAKTGKIIKENDKYVFNLINGYKLNIFPDQIEKLEFKNYNINLPIEVRFQHNTKDKNTVNIITIIKEKNYYLLSEKIFENLILLSIIIFFYFFILKENNLSLLHILKYISICILVLIINNIIKNIDLNFYVYLILNFLNILIVYLFLISRKLKIA